MEPGSTAKPLVVAAVLDSGLVTPTTRINTSGGTLAVGGKTVQDVHNYGQPGRDRHHHQVQQRGRGQARPDDGLRGPSGNNTTALGFGQPDRGGVSRREPRRLRHYKRWRPFEHATMAFGYSFSVTALQLAQAYAVLAADGVKRPVTLVKRDTPPPEERILKRQDRAPGARHDGDRGLRQGHRQARGRAGLPRRRQDRHRQEGQRAPRLCRRRYQSVFAGMVPAGNPRLVMVVMIDEPRGGAYYGGVVAAPVFAKVMEGPCGSSTSRRTTRRPP